MRTAILKIHLLLGLIGGIFLIILGLTGSIIAFEGDYDHWLYPDLWYVTQSGPVLPESDLITIVEKRFPPARVYAVEMQLAPNMSQVIHLTDGASVYVDPYNGKILGTTLRASTFDQYIGYIHRIHQMLVPDPRSAPKLAAPGKLVVSIAGLFLSLMVPTGLILWWRSKRASIAWKAPWYRVLFDAHRTIGIYAALFLWVASLTGIMIGFDFGEHFYYAITHSTTPERQQSWTSTPVQGATPLNADQALDIARRAMPNASVSILVMPVVARGSYNILMRVPEETSAAVHSAVNIDQYSGKVLHIRDYMTDSRGYRLIRFNRSLHTGDIFGLPSRIVMSLSSLLLVVMVITGVVTWWKKLA